MTGEDARIFQIALEHDRRVRDWSTGVLTLQPDRDDSKLGLDAHHRGIWSRWWSRLWPA